MNIYRAYMNGTTLSEQKRDPGESESEQAEQESRETTVSKPDGYRNDPDDPANPNEVRERHLKKLNH